MKEVTIVVIICIGFLFLYLNVFSVVKEDVSAESLETIAPSQLPLGPDPLIQETADLCDPANFRRKSGLFCIITGMEHTGTTITSSLVMNAPDLYGAFELGLMLAPTPREFRNVNPFFFDGIINPLFSHWWGLTKKQRDEMLEAECVAEQYNLLRKYSPIYADLNTSWLVDKTPAYYHNLYTVMKRTPGVPVIVTQKDDKDVLESYRKRNPSGKFEQEMKLRKFHAELELVKKHFPERVFVLNYTSFTEDPNRNMDMLFSFLGLRWDPAYLTNHNFNRKGESFGRRSYPAFNATRSICSDCNGPPI